jgi:2'-5' RNA ligase
MESPRAKGISLWLMPEGETGTRFSALIARLAASLGTEPFAPHVTLLAGLLELEAEALERAEKLARTLGPLRLRLEGLDGQDEPFRCLFARVETTAPLRAAHAAASRAFLREPDPGFLPHLSLVYGTLSPDQKAVLVRELVAEAQGEFEARRLHAWRTEGAVAEWRELAAFPHGAGQGRSTTVSATSGGSDR